MSFSLKELRGDVKAGNEMAAKSIDNLLDSTKKKYTKLHRDWYTYERFARGDHWFAYNKSLNKIQALPVSSGEIRRTVNKVRSQIRGVKNFIKRNQPRWEVQPRSLEKEDLEAAKQSNKIIQYVYEKNKFRGLLTSAITNGLKFSAGILEGGVFEKDGRYQIDFWSDDPFEIYIDPTASSLQEARYLIKCVKKPISTIQNNKNYKIKGTIVSDNKESESEYKDLLNTERYGSDSSGKEKDLETVTLKELWLKYIADGQVRIKVLTVAGGQLIRVRDTNYRRYPFFLYNPENDSNSIYSEPWIKDLISINKSLDKTVSQVEGYIQRMLAGKYLIKQGVEVSSITDKGAEKIYYNGNVAPVQQNLQPLPSTPFTYMSDLERYLEELGGVREASLGRVPGSLQSGRAVEALQAADAQTVSEPVENLEDMLSDIAEFILEVINDYQITAESIITDGEEIKYIGGGVKDVPSGTIVVKPSRVKVVIVPELAYSEEAKKDLLFKLMEAGLIDKQTMLEKLSISNVGDILERVNLEQEQNFQQEMMKQKESHRTSGEGPEDTADLADQENKAIALGQRPPLTPKALWTPEHLELHVAFIQDDPNVYEQNKEVFDEHMANEEQLINQ